MPTANPRRQELETAKEILAEVFGARPSDVEEMIRLRLEERSWSERGCGRRGLRRRGGIARALDRGSRASITAGLQQEPGFSAR
jgi:hypothetical protein